MAGIERMADGRPPGAGTEFTPPGGRSPSAEATRSPNPAELFFTNRKGERIPIQRMAGGEDPPTTPPTGENPTPPPNEGPRPPQVNLSQESIDAIKEPMERIAQAMGAVRRERGDEEEGPEVQPEAAEAQRAVRGRITDRDRHLKLDQDWYNTYVEFSHYKTLMTQARERGDTEEENYLQQKIWDRVNGNLSVLDTDEAGEAPGIQEILQSVNILFSTPEFDLFRQNISNWVEARMVSHNVAFAAKYLGAEDWQKAITNLRGRHFESLLTGPQAAGVKEAAVILEEADENGAKGMWYRNREASDEELKFFTADEQNNKALLDKIGPLKEGKRDWKKTRAWDLRQKYKLIENIFNDEELFMKIDGAKELVGYKEPNIDDFIDPATRTKDYNRAVEAENNRIRQLFKDNKSTWEKQYRSTLLYVLNGMEETVRKTVNKSSHQVIEEMEKVISNEKTDEDTKQSITNLLKVNDIPVDTNALADMMSHVNRDFTIADKINHATLQSSNYDGIFWSANAKIPEKYKGSMEKYGYQNVSDGCVIIDPVMHWDMRDDNNEPTGKIVTIHLAHDSKPVKESDSDEVKERKKAFANVLKVNSGYIAQAWAKASRDFYIDCWELINWRGKTKRGETAIGGRGARTWKKIFRKIADYMSAGEMSPGQMVHLRQYAGYTNTVTFAEFFGWDGIMDILNDEDRKGWDRQFNRVKYDAARNAAMAKLQGTIESKLLYDTHSIETPEAIAKTLGEIKNNAMILTKQIEGATKGDEQETFEYMERLSEGVLDFRAHHSEEAELKNMNLNQLDETARLLSTSDVITKHQYDHLLANGFNPHAHPIPLIPQKLREWVTTARVFRGFVSIKRGIFSALAKIGEESLKALSGK